MSLFVLTGLLVVAGIALVTEYTSAPAGHARLTDLLNSPPISGIATTLSPKIMKALGASKVAAIGYGVSPSSSAAVKSLQQFPLIFQNYQ